MTVHHVPLSHRVSAAAPGNRRPVLSFYKAPPQAAFRYDDTDTTSGSAVFYVLALFPTFGAEGTVPTKRGTPRN